MDPLSCIPLLQVTDKEDNQGQIVLKPEFFVKIPATQVESSLEACLREASKREAEVLQGLEALWEHGPRKLTNGLVEWDKEGGKYMFCGRWATHRSAASVP